ncbi:MAG: hypothetical protein LBL26_03425 [Peptococcaceae bacterium]|nr:hypothetical protein [Peptococcaceae bacterium]
MYRYFGCAAAERRKRQFKPNAPLEMYPARVIDGDREDLPEVFPAHQRDRLRSFREIY